MAKKKTDGTEDPLSADDADPGAQWMIEQAESLVQMGWGLLVAVVGLGAALVVWATGRGPTGDVRPDAGAEGKPKPKPGAPAGPAKRGKA